MTRNYLKCVQLLMCQHWVLPAVSQDICLAIYLKMTFESYLGLWQEEDKWYSDYKTSGRLPDMK